MASGLRNIKPSTTMITPIISQIRTKFTEPKDIIWPENYVKGKYELAQHRTPYGNYDDPQMRRNFNEPLHAEDDMLNMWSTDHFDFVSDKTALTWMAIFFGSLGLFATSIITFYKLEKPAVPRNYPYGGLWKELGGSEETKDLFKVSCNAQYI